MWVKALHTVRVERIALAWDAKRAVGCHGKCDRYKAWDGKRQAEKMERFRRTSILHEADKRKSAAVNHYKRRGRQI